MIITQTPFRMSFFGGGTDMESFFRENGGAVLSTTFDKYCYVNVRHLPRFFDYSTELSYSKTERVTCIEDIQHPAIRNAMKMLDIIYISAIFLLGHFSIEEVMQAGQSYIAYNCCISCSIIPIYVYENIVQDQIRNCANTRSDCDKSCLLIIVLNRTKKRIGNFHSFSVYCRF